MSVFAALMVTALPFTVRLVSPVRSEFTVTDELPEATMPAEDAKFKAPPVRVMLPLSCARM